jgi:hypothetical protein
MPAALNPGIEIAGVPVSLTKAMVLADSGLELKKIAMSIIPAVIPAFRKILAFA